MNDDLFEGRSEHPIHLLLCLPVSHLRDHLRWILNSRAVFLWQPTIEAQIQTPCGVADVSFVDPREPVKVRMDRWQISTHPPICTRCYSVPCRGQLAVRFLYYISENINTKRFGKKEERRGYAHFFGVFSIFFFLLWVFFPLAIK